MGVPARLARSGDEFKYLLKNFKNFDSPGSSKKHQVGLAIGSISMVWLIMANVETAMSYQQTMSWFVVNRSVLTNLMLAQIKKAA